MLIMALFDYLRTSSTHHERKLIRPPPAVRFLLAPDLTVVLAPQVFLALHFDQARFGAGEHRTMAAAVV